MKNYYINYVKTAHVLRWFIYEQGGERKGKWLPLRILHSSSKKSLKIHHYLYYRLPRSFTSMDVPLLLSDCPEACEYLLKLPKKED